MQVNKYKNSPNKITKEFKIRWKYTMSKSNSLNPKP